MCACPEVNLPKVPDRIFLSGLKRGKAIPKQTQDSVLEPQPLRKAKRTSDFRRGDRRQIKRKCPDLKSQVNV